MSSYPRKSPPAPKKDPAKQEFKIIQCAHILHMHEKAWSAIDIGDRKVVALCKHCEEAIVGRVLSSLYKEALKEYMEKHLPAAPVAPTVPVEVQNAEGICSEPNAERDTTIQS